MYYGFRLVALLCLLLSAIYSQPGWAESCGGRVGQMTINVPNIRYLPTLRADTQMTNAMADSGGGIHFVCDLQLPGASWKRIVYRQSNTAGSPRIINGQHVYASALSGMGYSLGFQCGGGPVHYIDGSNAPAGSESVTVCESSQLSTLLALREVVVKAYITFYKTGDVALVSGNHASVPGLPQVGNLYIEEQDSSRTARTASAPVSIDLAALNVDIGASGSCQVARPTINVNLGTVNKAEFKGKSTAAGVAQSTPRTPSTLVSPRRMASEKHTVRRMEVGTGRSHITTRIPARKRRSAMPEAMSPAPRITTSMQTPL